MSRREYKYMSLAEAIKSQEENFSDETCFHCSSKTVISKKTVPFLGITVWDLPLQVCPKCGEEYHRASIGIAVELLQEKHKLHGGYYVKDLLEIEREGKIPEHWNAE
ncbi:YgiT-type zinc finger protein [Microaerobacter geothermalis]|uniref:YgiT-type zinc finger protein n=1 Tax=Microaerobacter geothermalis TaxID=674972 RepID=UPI001F3D168F|nr:YgiT-type zinc finger protein [Microaerobacter geothermalis]MCF6095082.1 YgiT-type zinc finger protein [Microaerobacter geothermalis]